MPGRKAQNAAHASFWFGDEQALVFDVEALPGDVRFERGEIVLENECSRVSGIANPAGALVPRAQVAIGVVCGLRGVLRSRHFALPWACGPMRRDQYPLSG